MRAFFTALFLALAIVVTGFSLAGPVRLAAYAQNTLLAPDYDAWERVAQRAENALEDKRASNAAFEGLREELVTWRTDFIAAQDTNLARISTLRIQISALGPEPESGGFEPAELTLRRSELSEQLQVLEAPKLRAVEAFSRADGLIGETDIVIRERQTAQLFELQESPVNPTLWPGAIQELSASFVAAKSEVQSAWGSDALKKNLRENSVISLFFLLVAIVLLWRGRHWMVRLTSQVQGAHSGPNAGVRGFFLSLSQILLPSIGIYAFVVALFSTELLGFRGQLIADGLIPIGVAFFSARWLALRLLPRSTVRQNFLQIPEASAEKLRRFAGGLGLIWGGNRLLTQLADFDGYSIASRVVLQFPFILIAGFMLFHFGRTLRRSVDESGAELHADWSFRRRSTDMLGRVLIVVGVLGPLVAAIGYSTGAVAVVFPMILSLGLLALLIVLAGVMRDIYALLTGHDDETARNALIPILVSFVLFLMAIPVFALIWGARVADLNEIWTKFLAGYQLGETRISPTDFLTFAVVFVVGYMATRLMQSTLRSSVLPKTQIDAGGQTAIVSGLGYVGIFLAAVIAISTAGIDLSSLAIVAGALSVGIGFGLQNIVSNFVAGIILLIERPVAEGDWIEVGGYSGTVREISVRSTRIATFDRTEVIIPNSDLVSSAVTNYTRGNLVGRAVISVGVAYGTDTQKVERILGEIAQAHPLVSMDPGPAVHFIDFGADSMDFEIRAILKDVNFILRVKSDINHEIAKRFAEEGIEIPFAQRDVWLRNAGELPGGTAKPPPKKKPQRKAK